MSMPPGFQGLQVPVPLDDFEQAPTPHMVCRAASKPAPAGSMTMEDCDGEHAQIPLPQLLQHNAVSRDASNKCEGTHTLVHEAYDHLPSQEHSFDSFHPATDDGLAFGAPGPEVVTIKGGGTHKKPPTSKGGKTTMQGTFASTTECILQNLTMTVGNPSARRFANAPWRAFTWTCALLQETNTQPWGNLQAAVQESLELA